MLRTLRDGPKRDLSRRGLGVWRVDDPRPQKGRVVWPALPPKDAQERTRRGNRRRTHKRLALGELEPFASALLSVLLPFVLAGVPGQESELLELAAQFGVELDQGAGDAKPGRAGLARQPAATGENEH